MSELRIIKKYPNRRLYDTELSKYIKLVDLRVLIDEGIDFEVRDANTGEDITRTILLQIITDQECCGKPLFTTDILTQLIRSYGGDTQETFTDYLTNSLNLFSEQQKIYQDRLGDMMRGSPITAWSEMAKQNMDIWQETQKNFLKSAGMNTPSDKKEKSEPK